MSIELEKDLITGFSVDPESPSLFATQQLVDLSPGREINFELSAERWCVGFDEPAGTVGACPDGALAQGGDRCQACLDRTKILPCLRCTGDRCGNAARRSNCVFSDHYVYLAAYTPELFKVGVTRIERFERRILEQGAWGGIAIAAAGGQEVRRIESAISRAGWPDRVQMLPLLADDPMPADQAEELLRMQTRRIIQRLPDERIVSDGPFVYHAKHYPQVPGMTPRTLDPEADPLAGTILGIRGGWLVLDAAGEKVAVSLRNLNGRELRARESQIMGPAQGALAF